MSIGNNVNNKKKKQILKNDNIAWLQIYGLGEYLCLAVFFFFFSIQGYLRREYFVDRRCYWINYLLIFINWTIGIFKNSLNTRRHTPGSHNIQSASSGCLPKWARTQLARSKTSTASTAAAVTVADPGTVDSHDRIRILFVFPMCIGSFTRYARNARCVYIYVYIYNVRESCFLTKTTLYDVVYYTHLLYTRGMRRSEIK